MAIQIQGVDQTKVHKTTHAVSGVDTVFPADPGADRVLMWDDDPGELVWASPTAVTDIDDFLENPPTEDEAHKAPTSEWAFDHDASLVAHNSLLWAIVFGG